MKAFASAIFLTTGAATAQVLGPPPEQPPGAAYALVHIGAWAIATQFVGRVSRSVGSGC